MDGAVLVQLWPGPLRFIVVITQITCILAEGATALPVTLSGGALFAS